MKRPLTTPPLRLLIVDDETKFADVLAKELAREGHDCAVRYDGKSALSVFDDGDFDVVLLDLKLPDSDGLELLVEFKSRDPLVEVIMLTGHGSLDSAIQAMKVGAYDYLTKPCQLDELSILVEKAADRGQTKRENLSLRQHLGQSSKPLPLIVASEEMRRIVDQIGKVARATDVPVLITGESGTGKELVAREVHAQSPAQNEAFIAVNCAALRSELLESEIFGHEKGAFTGATSRTDGIVEVARGGTLFLDEIGEIDEAVQAKLLRFIQFGEYRRVGGTEERRADVRIVAATNRELRREIEAGRFRDDLYYRLNVAEIHVPPLRDRPDDIRPLVVSFLTKYAGRSGPASIDDSALDVLSSYAWPGNVRELENFVRRILIFLEGDRISSRTIQDAFRGIRLDPADQPTSLRLHDVSRAHIERVLSLSSGNKTLAAKKLGIAVKTLYNKLAEYKSEDENKAKA